MATLRVVGRSAARVTDVLGISSDDLRGRSGVRRASGDTPGVWLLGSSAHPRPGVELAASLQQLLDRVEPVTDRLCSLAAEGYTVTWFCYIGSHAVEHAVELDRVTLTRLLTLPGDLWLDIYPDDGD